MKTKSILYLLSAILVLAGCATLDPNADPLVVRAEQLERAALATLQLALKTDNLDREFFATKLPAYHQFCKQMREQIPYQETNSLPRYRVAILTLDDTIVDYKLVKDAAHSNALAGAKLALEKFLTSANQWLLVATNLPKGTP